MLNEQIVAEAVHYGDGPSDPVDQVSDSDMDILREFLAIRGPTKATDDDKRGTIDLANGYG